jgi:hypothetical protein
MICNKCHKENIAGAKFCKFCGAPLEEKVVAPVSEKEPVKNKKRSIIVYLSYLFSGLGFIFLIGSSIYYAIGLTNLFAERSGQQFFNIYGGLMFAACTFIVIAVILEVIYAFMRKGADRNFNIFAFVINAIGLFFVLMCNFWSGTINSLYMPLYYFFFGFGFLLLIVGTVTSLLGLKRNNKE